MVSHRFEPFSDIRLGKEVDLLVRKVDRALTEDAQFEKLSLNPMHALRERARQGPQRAPGRLARGAVDEVEHRLRLRQVHLAVDECPLRELSRFRTPCAERQHPFKQHVEHHGAAMSLQFQHVLAGQ